MIVDMHCHLDLYQDPFAVAKEASVRGVGILSVTTTPKAWNGTKKLETGNKGIYTALGLHPQLAAQRINELDLFDEILPSTPYVGEIGLDGGKGFKDDMDKQLVVFRHILSSVNAAGGRLLSIHSRAAADLVLEEIQGIDAIPILHWFTGSKRELRDAISQNCWFSVGPAMTRSKRGAELIKEIPRGRILAETDGPFGKAQGKAYKPWDCHLVYDDLSDRKSVV